MDDMIMSEVFWKNQWLIYKATGIISKDTYYGYCNGYTLSDAQKSFNNNLNDRVENRGTILLFDANSNNISNIKFSLITSTVSEFFAREKRNKLRTDDVSSITHKSYFMSHKHKTLLTQTEKDNIMQRLNQLELRGLQTQEKQKRKYNL